MSQPFKGFYITSRAYYARQSDPAEILIGLYHPGGGTTGEFAIKWHTVGSSTKSVPRLEIYDDAWRVFFALHELRALAEFANKNADEQRIVNFLVSAGFKDLTQYEGSRQHKTYSVLLLYPESDNEGGAETYLAHISAPDKQRAIGDARAEACRANAWSEDRVADFAVLLVSEGHVTDIGEA